MNRVRSGYSLVEMLATIAVTAAVLTVVTGWLIALLRGESASRDQVLYSTAQDRLARQFRDDAHAALDVAAATGGDANDLVRFTLDDDVTVAYRLDGDRLHRLQQRGTQVVRRESYRLPPPGRARVELTPTAEPTLASLLIEQGAAPTDSAARRTLRIDAHRGLHGRFAAAEGVQ